MNLRATKAIYRFEMARFFRTPLGSLVSPVISTALYFVVFGAAIGGRIEEVEGVSYGAFIVPGLIMLTVLTQSISNASFGIYFPKFIGTIYELLSAPASFLEITAGYVGAAATKSLIIGLVILATSFFFVDLEIRHPVLMLAFLVLTCISFSLLGFIIGIWAGNFEQLQLVPLLVVTPLVFLGGSFYSIAMLPAHLADGRAVQPGRLPDLGLPLGVLRAVGRAGGAQPRRHGRASCGLPDRDLVDLPHRLAPPGLTAASAAPAPASLLRRGARSISARMRHLIPFLKGDPAVAVVRLQGIIASGSRGAALSDAGLAPLIERAFRRGRPRAVALVINSPGGSAAQSSLIAARIRRLADERKVPVFAFVEDVAASGGYWLATAADEIWADANSIVGSIGVISAGFGFHEFIERHGVERRVHTSGRSKCHARPVPPGEGGGRGAPAGAAGTDPRDLHRPGAASAAATGSPPTTRCSPARSGSARGRGAWASSTASAISCR